MLHALSFLVSWTLLSFAVWVIFDSLRAKPDRDTNYYDY